MRQAITTKFLGPTNSRGSRIKATAAAGSVTVSWEYALNSDQNHDAAAKALAEKLGWDGVWVSGGLPSQEGNVYVWTAQGPSGVGYRNDGFTVLQAV